jgi:membrane protein
MIWLYLSWIILLVGASISFYHQNPEQLKWKKNNLHLSGRMRDQLALQAMVDIARAHDRQSTVLPSLENLAISQQVPVDVLQRMLDALQADGWISQSAEETTHYLPAVSLQRIRLLDILRSARQAEDDGQTERFRSDAVVDSLLRELEQGLELRLGEETLADFLQKFEDDAKHEDSLV